MPKIAEIEGSRQDGGAALRHTLAQAPAGTVVLTTLAIVAALNLGRDVFLPLAIAMLITFALSPLVTRLRGFGLPMIASVLAAVTLAFAVIGMLFLVVAGQVGQLAQELPRFQDNIVTKLGALQETGSENGLVVRLSRMAAEINAQIATTVPTDGTANGTEGPLAVEVVENRGPFETLQDIALQLIKPIATAGIVIVVVVFMLLERDELRDRFIRLVGANDINRTTQVIEDAGKRVGTYLLIQLLVNIIYAVPIGIGLMLIGVPNAVLWGLVTLVVRFVPYIGPVIAAIFPLFLAFAVSPDWSMVIWTAALFLTVEIVSSNVIEPWLYGSRTGISPLAVIVAAIFWTWIWGPLGLVLSTPLTVCLVVVGRYIPQFAVFDVLFGDQPVLAAHSRLYQRLLVGDAVESTLRAEELLEDDFITNYHRDVGLPALLLAQRDYERGGLSQEQLTRFADTAEHFLDELDQVVTDELSDAKGATEAHKQGDGETPDGGAKMDLAGAHRRLVLLGGRTRLDDLAARMLAQAAASEGAEVTVLLRADLTPSWFARVTHMGPGCILLNFLDTAPSRASLLHIRRLKRTAPQMRVGIVLWQAPEDPREGTPLRRISQAKLAEIMEIGADFHATSMEDALALAFEDAAPRPATKPNKRPKSRTTRLVPARAVAVSETG
ncbi:AI-2E family transporter [Tabrizicola sp.]|uniref:AI-2E family transporter n=1 Tax=Tabrizicola sp. TaxID=2005166 RepID=UPI00286CA9E6|nr:AI-2E family transporter [Tabrizicola sp.]